MELVGKWTDGTKQIAALDGISYLDSAAGAYVVLDIFQHTPAEYKEFDQDHEHKET